MAIYWKNALGAFLDPSLRVACCIDFAYFKLKTKRRFKVFILEKWSQRVSRRRRWSHARWLRQSHWRRELSFATRKVCCIYRLQPTFKIIHHPNWRAYGGAHRAGCSAQGETDYGPDDDGGYGSGVGYASITNKAIDGAEFPAGPCSCSVELLAMAFDSVPFPRPIFLFDTLMSWIDGLQSVLRNVILDLCPSDFQQFHPRLFSAFFV